MIVAAKSLMRKRGLTAPDQALTAGFQFHRSGSARRLPDVAQTVDHSGHRLAGIMQSPATARADPDAELQPGRLQREIVMRQVIGQVAATAGRFVTTHYSREALQAILDQERRRRPEAFRTPAGRLQHTQRIAWEIVDGTRAVHLALDRRSGDEAGSQAVACVTLGGGGNPPTMRIDCRCYGVFCRPLSDLGGRPRRRGASGEGSGRSSRRPCATA